MDISYRYENNSNVIKKPASCEAHPSIEDREEGNWRYMSHFHDKRTFCKTLPGHVIFACPHESLLKCINECVQNDPDICSNLKTYNVD